MLLTIEKDIDRPIYLQIIGQIKEQVGNGTLKPGDELPSVRDVAGSVGINLHTVRSAYLKLREQGIINLHLGRRATIARQPILPNVNLEADIRFRLKELITDALLSGMSPDGLRQLVDHYLNKLDDDVVKG